MGVDEVGVNLYSDVPRKISPSTGQNGNLLKLQSTLVDLSYHQKDTKSTHLSPRQSQNSLHQQTVLAFDRPVGSKFKMVRPYYSAKRAHNVPGHAHSPLPHTPPGIPALECYCSQIAF